MSDEAVTYSRDVLVAICERAVVPVKDWHDRDSAGAQEGVGKAWVLLRAGADFKVRTEGNCATDDRTIWVDFTFPGFQAFEWGHDAEFLSHELIYLPTPGRLAAAAGSDWY